MGPLYAIDTMPVRIKDIVHVEGVRSNMLVGYGLVVGLNGTGDSLRSSPFTKESMVGMLDRLGVGTRGPNMNAMNTRNTAAVMVTARLPPFARQGSPIDVTVSAMGDAKSLRGGTLLVTPLLGSDSQAYAVAQGMLANNSFQAQGAEFQGRESGTSVTKGVPTTAIIINGAIVEREVEFDFQNMSTVHLSLRNPDFTTAKRIEASINHNIFPIAKATDPSTIALTIPDQYSDNPMRLLSEIEALYVVPDSTARVIINEREGVVIITDNVRIGTVAISHGNLTVSIQEDFNVSQPGNYGNFGIGGAQAGRTAVTQDVDITAQQEEKQMGVLKARVKLQDLVDGLNAFNLPASDMSSVLRAIHAAGAMHAQLEIR